MNEQETTTLSEEDLKAQELIQEKLNQMFTLINEMLDIDPTVSQIMANGFFLSVNLLQAVAEKGTKEISDVSKQIELVSTVLGFNLEEMVSAIIQEKSQQGAGIENSKEPDEETLKFITSDMDDYERFLAEAKAKESLDFLKNTI
jgi:hypothetical protein